jgi:hypothetical protein
MTNNIATLPHVFPGLKSLSLVMNWSGQFIVPGNTLADRNQTLRLLRSRPFGQVVVGLFTIVNALANVKLAHKSVHDPAWSNGPVSFNGSRKAALARLVAEDLVSGAPQLSILIMRFCRQRMLPEILASDDEDEPWIALH